MLAPSRAAVPSPNLRRVRLLAMVLLAAAVLTGGWLLLRDAPLLAINDVTVTGASGPETAAIRSALTVAARDMTTLHVREDALRTAVEPFPVVRSVSADVSSPRGLEIVVEEHTPVALIVAGSRRVPVAADGTLLRGTVTRDLPVLETGSLPGGARLGAGADARAVALLAAAPAALRREVERVRTTRRGLSVRLAGGPAVIFGTPGRAQAKWAAAARVLADRSSGGAAYIDVRSPERPAAGGFAAAVDSVAEPAEPAGADGAAGPAEPAGTADAAPAPPPVP